MMSRLLRRASLAASILLLLSVLSLYFHSYLFCGWQLPSSSLRILLVADPQIVGYPSASRGRLAAQDVAFNDAYIHHRFSTSVSALHPTHIVLLGDLLSSEHIPDGEFALRVERLKWMLALPPGLPEPLPPVHYLAGNHDIGYGALLDASRADRFARAFGPLDAVHRAGGHLLVLLNAQSLEAGGRYPKAHETTWATVDEARHMAANESLVPLVFLHIPLHKDAGVCVDPPLTRLGYGGAVDKQNMLTPETSAALLERLAFPPFIFNGHDHEGCRVEHPGGVSEVTVRSVMAEYGGNVGLFEATWEGGKWRYAYRDCPFVDHVVVKVVVIAAVVVWAVTAVVFACTRRQTTAKPKFV